MANQHRYWLVIYPMGYRKFAKLKNAQIYLAHHEEQLGPAILVGCD